MDGALGRTEVLHTSSAEIDTLTVYAPVAQTAEARHSKSRECGFESHLEYDLLSDAVPDRIAVSQLIWSNDHSEYGSTRFKFVSREAIRAVTLFEWSEYQRHPAMSGDAAVHT